MTEQIPTRRFWKARDFPTRKVIVASILVWIAALGSSFVPGMPFWLSAMVFFAPYVAGLLWWVSTTMLPGPNLTIFRIGYWLTTAGMIVAALTLATNTWQFATTNKATPDGELRFAIGWDGYRVGLHSPTDPDWSAPADPVDKAFVDGSSRWTDELRAKMPTSWTVNGPFEWEAGAYKYRDRHSVLASSRPEAEVAIPDREVPNRADLWIPTLLREAGTLIVLFWARRIFKTIINSGPFDSTVYRMLRYIALLMVVGGIFVNELDTSMLNHFYAALDLQRLGVYAERHSDSMFNPIWLVALVVVEILRYGSLIQQENNETV